MQPVADLGIGSLYLCLESFLCCKCRKGMRRWGKLWCMEKAYTMLWHWATHVPSLGVSFFILKNIHLVQRMSKLFSKNNPYIFFSLKHYSGRMGNSLLISKSFQVTSPWARGFWRLQEAPWNQILSHLSPGGGWGSTHGHVCVSGKIQLLSWKLEFSQFKPFSQATTFLLCPFIQPILVRSLPWARPQGLRCGPDSVLVLI